MDEPDVIVVDYGMGNLESVARAFRRVGAAVKVSSDPDDIARAERICLPGVGSFAQGMANLHEYGLVDVLNQRVLEDGAAVMGICLGYQMFTDYSEEGDAEGLGWIPGQTLKFDFSEVEGGERLKIPHMGWNDLHFKQETPLLAELKGAETHGGEASCFFFQHSYAVQCDDPEDVLTTTLYGYEFVSSVYRDNICGFQFHPEKSTANGLQLVRNFLEVV